jgi:hypothetical protein
MSRFWIEIAPGPWPRPMRARPLFCLAPSRAIRQNRPMTNKIALGLGLLIVAAFAVDAYAFGGEMPVFLGRKLFEFLEWLAFWR